MQNVQFERFKRIDQLIRIKGTGTPSQLAKRLGFSERTVYDYINTMKDMGAPIKYCNFRQSYYYEEDGFFQIGFYARKTAILWAWVMSDLLGLDLVLA
ncbi:MAG: HTH domain-containing protein [Chitinophagaceae bacterium]|nr:HTH domain-containing protein [Chitinophagaceae bacterium]